MNFIFLSKVKILSFSLPKLIFFFSIKQIYLKIKAGQTVHCLTKIKFIIKNIIRSYS